MRARADAERAERYRRTLERGDIPCILAQAKKGLAAIARRRLHQDWKQDPRIPGATIAFVSPHDREKTRQWLIENCRVDPDAPLDATGHMPTPRCLDRLLWAGWRVVRTNGEASPEFIQKARFRVVSAIRDDVTFWKKWEAAGGDDAGG